MKLLVVVDMQVDFVTGVLGSENAQRIVPNVVNKVKNYLEKGNLILFTRDSHDESYLESREGINLPTPHCIIGTEGHNLIPELQKIYDEYSSIMVNLEGVDFPQVNCVYKYDQFGIPLYEIQPIPKDEQFFESIEIIGVATNMCVISCAICLQNIYRYLPITIDASCCASFDSELHLKALDVMKSIQMNIINH